MPAIQFQKKNSSYYFKLWSQKVSSGCSGNFKGYSSKILRLKNVLMDKIFASVVAKFGKLPNESFSQREEDEVYSLKHGFFQMNCEHSTPNFAFDKKSPVHLTKWLSSISYNTSSNIFLSLVNKTQETTIITNFTVATMRYEYSNVYWTVMDLYNIFLMVKFFNQENEKTTLVIIDQRPRTKLDDLYTTVYNVKWLHFLQSKTFFYDMVWNIGRAHGPFLTQENQIPYLLDFRATVLKAFQLSTYHHRVCVNLNILLLLRRDYIAHPRNPSGYVSRKIQNENEIIDAIRQKYPHANVKGLQLDLLSMKEQISVISETDILIGMHGAAFGFSPFLPPGSGAIEIFPQYYKAKNWHMEHLINNIQVHYIQWRNNNKSAENQKLGLTILPVKNVTNLIQNMFVKICEQQK